VNTPGPPAGEARCPACETLLGETCLRGTDRLHGTAGEFQVRCCPNCGSGTTFPPAQAAELASFYPRTYGPYDDRLGRVASIISLGIRWHQGRRALRTSPLNALRAPQTGRVLDVGCGRGDLAAVFVKRGWQATGVEPSASACAAARARGVDARQGTLDDISLPNDDFDAAIFQHSLEHTSDPVAQLAKVRAAVRRGGFVLITVPNFGSWQRRRFGNRWYHLDLPRHRVHFTAKGLEAALGRAGLEVESMSTSTSTVGLPATIQYVIAERCLFPRGLSLRVASGLCVLVQPLAAVLDRLRDGGDQLHVVARRPVSGSSRGPVRDA
jgi:SAM-dependent methyltransferase